MKNNSDLKMPLWKYDYLRTVKNEEFHFFRFLKSYLFHHSIRYMFYLRKAQCAKNRFTKLFFETFLFRLGRKHGIEIKSATTIGAGFVMIHPYNITIHPNSKIGRNVCILKGATIGMSGGGEKRHSRYRE